MAYFMGADLGTSSLKILVIDEQGKTIALCSKDYQFDSPKNAYAEQDPEIWWQAFCHCSRNIAKTLGPELKNIQGLSFSGQMHGCVFLDAQGHSIRPAILHCDARSAKQVEAIKAKLGTERIAKDLKNAVYTGFMLPSLLWLRENELDNFKKINTILLPKDYLKWRLSQVAISDFSDASATLLFDLEAWQWSEKIVKDFELPREIFPRCETSCAPIGEINRAAARESGLPEGLLLVNGGGDQVMQSIGAGSIEEGQATVNIGTSGQVCFQSKTLIQNPALNSNSFCAYEKGRYITMGATMSAGLCLRWLNGVLEQKDYVALNESIDSLPPGSGGLIFLPYLQGERTPHLNPNLSASFFGLTPNSGRAEMSRAVMEGVAYSLRQCIALCETLGLFADEFIASGGGARSKPWLQLQSDIYQRRLKTTATVEQACLGAAITASVGAAFYPSIAKACAKIVRYKDQIEAIPESSRIYNRYYDCFLDCQRQSAAAVEKLTLLGRSSPS